MPWVLHPGLYFRPWFYPPCCTFGHNLTVAAFNGYFLSMVKTLVKSQGSSDSDKNYACSKRLVDFCQQKTKGTDWFAIPLIAVREIGKFIFEMDSKMSSRPEDISSQLL